MEPTIRCPSDFYDLARYRQERRAQVWHYHTSGGGPSPQVDYIGGLVCMVNLWEKMYEYNHEPLLIWVYKGDWVAYVMDLLDDLTPLLVARWKLHAPPPPPPPLPELNSYLPPPLPFEFFFQHDWRTQLHKALIEDTPFSTRKDWKEEQRFNSLSCNNKKRHMKCFGF